MMAIEAAVASADTLEEARKEVAGLTGSIGSVLMIGNCSHVTAK